MWQLLESQMEWWAGHRVRLPGIFGITFVYIAQFANGQIQQNDLIIQPSKQRKVVKVVIPYLNLVKTEMSLFYYSNNNVCRGKERESQRLRRPLSRSPTYLPTFLRPTDNPRAHNPPINQQAHNSLTNRQLRRSHSSDQTIILKPIILWPTQIHKPTIRSTAKC